MSWTSGETIIASRLEDKNDRDVENGYASVGGHILQLGSYPYPIREEYTNHLGATDNFVQTAISESGAVSSDITNHVMNLATGSTGHAQFETKKYFIVNGKPLIANFLIKDIINGTGAGDNGRACVIGLNTTFTGDPNYIGAHFIINSGNNTYTETRADLGDGATSTYVTTPTSGDLLTISLTSGKCLFYRNGSLIATHTTNIPTQLLKVGATVDIWNNQASTTMSLGIDMMSIIKYY